MKTFIPQAAAMLLVFAIVVYFPHATLNPGKLLNGHGEVKENCLACHSPFRGASAEKCMACHQPEGIGRVSVSGAPIVPAEEKALFHQRLANKECAGCHSEHNGPDADRATRHFSHDFLEIAVKDECASCHLTRKPPDQLHDRVEKNCAACHAVSGWKPAEFDHNRLIVSGQNECAACHLAKRPDDALHRQVRQNCAACHTTQAWKPATFEHEKYFRFDRHHPEDCQTCHTNPQRFSEYTCYGCHEHFPARIAEKHRKEGILQFEDCVQCHRSGDKDETKQMGRDRRPGKETKKRKGHREDYEKEGD